MKARRCHSCKKMVPQGAGKKLGGKGKHVLCQACYKQQVDMFNDLQVQWSKIIKEW